MSSYKKFSVEDRVYNKGRRAKYVYNGTNYEVMDVIEKDLKELNLTSNNQLIDAWVSGFDSNESHNPLPKPFEFEAPPLVQKIKFEEMVRGVVMAYVKGGNIFIGWSIRRKDDPIKYDPEWAVTTARVTARPLHKFTQDQLPKFSNKKKVFVKTDGFTDTYETFEEHVAFVIYAVIGRAFHYYQQISIQGLEGY